MNGREVSLEDAQRHAKKVFMNMIPFAMMNSTTEEKKEAFVRLSQLRIEVQEQFDIICPGWEQVGD